MSFMASRRRTRLFGALAAVSSVLRLGSLIFWSPRCAASSHADHDDDGEEQQHEELPPMVDSEDIEFFFEGNDLDTLYKVLRAIFHRSSRNPDPSQIVHELPEELVARGGGTMYTTAYKIQHDIEQAAYLAENIGDDLDKFFFRDVVGPTYTKLLEGIPPVEELERTQGLYAFTEGDRRQLKVNAIYNKALHLTEMDVPKDSDGKEIPLINPGLDADAIQRQWFGEDDGVDDGVQHPGIIYVDNLLTPETLAAIQEIMWTSTVWYQTKLPLKFGGYLGAYIDDGLYDRILLQLSKQLYDFLPRIFHGHALRYMWAYKYSSEYTGINLHADQAAVNVNIWLTPDEANLDPDSGGLVVFTAKPPPDWEFAQYNTDTELVREKLLAPTGFSNVTIPYRLNRAVIFDSALFHQTDNFRFKKGYKNRRLNLTLLYGLMRVANKSRSSTSASTTAAAGEEAAPGKDEL